MRPGQFRNPCERSQEWPGQGEGSKSGANIGPRLQPGLARSDGRRCTTRRTDRPGVPGDNPSETL